MTTRSRYTAAITDKPWWLAGGIPSANCVAAYRAKGASDYVASKVNLANPGTYNATDGAEYPTWAVTTGWTFNGSSQFLTTGIYPTENMSVIIRFDGATKPANNYPTLFGSVESGRNFYIHTFFMADQKLTYVHGSNSGGYPVTIVDVLPAGVVSISKYSIYVNGIYRAAITAGWSGTSTVPMPIGKRSDGYWYAGNITALAFYSLELSNHQVTALTNAMNAL